MEAAVPLDRLIEATQRLYLVNAALNLGILSALEDGPLAAQALAERIQVPGPRLGRLLKGLVWAQVLAERGGSYTLTEEGRRLTDTSPVGLSENIRYYAEFLAPAWAEMGAWVRDGIVPFERAKGGPLFERLAGDRALAEAFVRPMAMRSAEYSRGIAALAEFSPVRTVVDVAGGDGRLLADLLRERDHLEGILFDLPALRAAAEARIAAAGLQARCRFEPGDMFAAVPVGADAYLLKWVLHDWDDEHAGRILGRIRDAAKPGSKLIIIERLMAEKGPDALSLVPADLNMLALNGGAERTAEAYRRLLAEAGFRPIAVREFENRYLFSALIAEA